MTAQRAPRRAIVCGAGGVLGFAWMLGALKAVEQADGVDCRSSEVLLGTSAGSVLVALLGAGVSVDTMLNTSRGVLVQGDPRIEYDYDSERAAPPWPQFRLGSVPLLRRVARHPLRYPPLTALSSVLPRGRAAIDPVGRMIDSVVPRGGWAPHPATWIVAMDYDTGDRVAFGRPGSPPAGLSDAVMASCAIPGWYSALTIRGRRYVDGGAASTTSVDLLAGCGLEEVLVLAPMASFDVDAPASVIGRIERQVRRATTRRLRAEAERVRRAGAAVRLLAPGPADLAAIGLNMMDSSRRDDVLRTSLRSTAAALAEQPWLAAG